MPFNNCKNFVSECGCGARHVVNLSFFDSIKDEYDQHTWTISHISYETTEPEGTRAFGDEKLTVTIQNKDQQQHHFHFDSKGNFAGQGCFCEPLLFIMINFEISDEVVKTLLAAIKKHADCWPLYRYENEILTLIQHLKKKKNTKEILSFFRKNWFSYYKTSFLKKMYFRYFKENRHSPLKSLQ